MFRALAILAIGKLVYDELYAEDPTRVGNPSSVGPDDTVVEVEHGHAGSDITLDQGQVSHTRDLGEFSRAGHLGPSSSINWDGFGGG